MFPQGEEQADTEILCALPLSYHSRNENELDSNQRPHRYDRSNRFLRHRPVKGNCFPITQRRAERTNLTVYLLTPTRVFPTKHGTETVLDRTGCLG